MHRTMYTMKEKLAHLDKAKAAMENGTGSFHSYAKEKVSVPGRTSTNSSKSGVLGHSERDLTFAGTG